jgi:hypothetical protein
MYKGCMRQPIKGEHILQRLISLTRLPHKHETNWSVHSTTHSKLADDAMSSVAGK